MMLVCAGISWGLSALHASPSALGCAAGWTAIPVVPATGPLGVLEEVGTPAQTCALDRVAPPGMRRCQATGIVTTSLAVQPRRAMVSSAFSPRGWAAPTSETKTVAPRAPPSVKRTSAPEPPATMTLGPLAAGLVPVDPDVTSEVPTPRSPAEGSEDGAVPLLEGVSSAGARALSGTVLSLAVGVVPVRSRVAQGALAGLGALMVAGQSVGPTPLVSMVRVASSATGTVVGWASAGEPRA